MLVVVTGNNNVVIHPAEQFFTKVYHMYQSSQNWTLIISANTSEATIDVCVSTFALTLLAKYLGVKLLTLHD